jgi:RHS repeat-associated protein
LPTGVTFASGGFIQHGYTADGIKRRMMYKEADGSGNPVPTVYCCNVVYENSVGRLLLTEEGYVTLSDKKYHYYLQDHQGNNRVVLSSSGAVEEANHYYPFGGVFASSGNVQPYKYNGKELDVKKGLNWYDYGARHYDAALGRFTTVDPLSEKYYPIGMYAYCNNNPVRYIDPTGMFTSPIYDEEGKLLGTDDEGLQGVAIIMNKSNFKQGMSHEEALSHDLGYNGLVDDEARTNYLKSYTSLKDRPDYDGYLTLEEANKWYREGNGQPLFTSLAKIDLSGIYSLGERYVGEIKSFNLLLHSGSLNDGLVYVTLKRYPNHSVRAFSDKYDFEMHNGRNPLNWGRNIETVIGNRVAGKGQAYEINIYGSAKLTPFLPWIK